MWRELLGNQYDTRVVEVHGHLSDEQLEGHSIANLAEQDMVRPEEHVLICEACEDKLALSENQVERP